MIRIAICDNDYRVTGAAEKLIQQVCHSLCQEVAVRIFFSGENFCAFLNKSIEPFDIVLMDIEMGEISGIDAGHKLREDIENDNTLLIYISNHKSYYADIIDLNVFCFIPKPIENTEFTLKLKKAMEKVRYQKQFNLFPDFSYNKNGREMYVPIRAIKYLESDRRMIYLYTTLSTDTISYYGNLNAEEKKLPENMFCRIHRSYIVCFAHITSITATTITIDKMEFNISTKYRESTKYAYCRYRGN